MTKIDKRKLGLHEDLLGVVLAGKFIHAECFEKEIELVAAVEDEDANTVVLSSDSWIHEVGPCKKCGLHAGAKS